MTTTIDLGDLLTTKEAATLLGLKANTLEIYRHQGKGPPFLKLGNEHGSAVRYQRSVLAAWLAQRSFESTSAHTAAIHARRNPGFCVAPAPIPGPWTGTSGTSSQPQGASE